MKYEVYFQFWKSGRCVRYERMDVFTAHGIEFTATEYMDASQWEWIWGDKYDAISVELKRNGVIISASFWTEADGYREANRG